jgi:ribonucleoside-diphosphate reductase beta chain
MAKIPNNDAIFSQCINWNRIEDPIDGQVYDQLIANFWVPERISLSSDLPSWRRMTEEERAVTGKAFVNLTCLDHLQATVGAISLIEDSTTPHEAAVYTVIAQQESNHARSYSYVFSSLYETHEIDALFEWVKDDPYVRRKIDIFRKYYKGDNPYHKKIASTLLESYAFYSQFFWPFYQAARGKLTATANVISLIVADEAVHGAFIGAKYQRSIKNLTQTERDELQQFTIELFLELHENEERFVESVYDDLGGNVTSQVKSFLKYNANRALQNLGYESLFSADQTEVGAEIISALNPSNANHDFFSMAGSQYKMLKTEKLEEEDWNF